MLSAGAAIFFKERILHTPERKAGLEKLTDLGSRMESSLEGTNDAGEACLGIDGGRRAQPARLCLYPELAYSW